MDEKKRQEIQQEINNLECDLASNQSAVGDWKVIKCYEAKLQGKELPYDIDQLMADREAVRVKIRELIKQLEPETTEEK